MKYTILKADPQSDISCERELYTHGHVYVCRDRREEYCFIAQRVKFIADAITTIVGEEVKLSSLYEASRRKQKCGYNMSFQVERMPTTQLQECSFHTYRQVFVLTAPFSESAWTLQKRAENHESNIRNSSNASWR